MNHPVIDLIAGILFGLGIVGGIVLALKMRGWRR